LCLIKGEEKSKSANNVNMRIYECPIPGNRWPQCAPLITHTDGTGTQA